MKPISSLEDLQQVREAIIEEKQHNASQGIIKVTISLGTCGIAAGALDTLQAVEQFEAEGMQRVAIGQTGCFGLCKFEPILEVIAGDPPKVTTYGYVTPQVALRILREHVLGGKVVEEFVVESIPFPSI
jgi:NADP-reducing hydrogenase subunit HndB